MRFYQVHGEHPGLCADAALGVSVTGNDQKRAAIVRPLTIGLIGLALAVVLWGIGYRLSQYRPHPGPSTRVGVAKLWVGPRKAACVKSAQTKATRPPATTFLLLTSPNFYYSSCSNLHSSATSVCGAKFRFLLGTLRSPPAH